MPDSNTPANDNFGARLAASLRVIGYQRFALGMVVALVVMMTVPQIREFLLIYRILSWPGICELIFVALSALAAWYAGRLAYRIDPNPREPGTAPELHAHPRLRRWLPRAYALAVPLAPAFASFELGLTEKGLLYSALALLLFFGVTARRSAMRRMTRRPDNLKIDPADDRVASGWRELGVSEKRVIAAALFTLIVLVVLSTFQPNWAAAAFGTTGILFLSGSVVAIFGTVVIQQAVRVQLPFTLLLLVLLGSVALIPIGKQHPVRSADPSTPTPEEQRDTPMPDPFHGSTPILVAAEGGGIRAAYWAALAMHTLDLLSDGEFRRRVTLASGVSGGSLGIATYAQAAVAPPLEDDDCSVPPIALPTVLPDSNAARALNLGHCFLAEDYLGPVALRLLWHDAPRLIVPIPFWTDRGEALEDGWSRQWHRLTQRDDFDQPLSSLDSRSTTWVFNSTHVESGRRVIQSAPWIPALQDLAPAAIDGRTVVGTGIELKQAVHNSARFTYVSPTGAVDRDGSVLQLVDGGYFENSGLTLVNDWLLYSRDNRDRAADSAGTPDPFDADAKAQTSADPPMITGLSAKAKRSDPLVLLLSNDPSVAPVPSCADDDAAPGRFVNEVIAPLDSLLQVRSARGAYAREQARRLVGDDSYFQLAIRPSEDDVTVPLGWALSEESIVEMQRQMWCEPAGCGYSNAQRLLQMAQRIGSDVEQARETLLALCAIPSDAAES